MMTTPTTKAATLQSASARLEVHILDRQIPVRIQDFKAPLFLFLIGLLIGIELLDHRGAVKIVVGDRRILEDDGDPVIPSPVFGRVAPCNGHAHLSLPPYLIP